MSDKMELTKEIKLKVFSQYLGQAIRLEAGFDRKLIAVGGVDDEPYIKMRLGKAGLGQIIHAELIQVSDAKLILKPLSSITDEHKKTVLKLQDYNEKQCEDYVIHHFSHLNGVLDINICPKDHQHDNYEPAYSSTVDFLRNEGYDVPHYLLGGKTLQEYGLCVYETDL